MNFGELCQKTEDFAADAVANGSSAPEVADALMLVVLNQCLSNGASDEVILRWFKAQLERVRLLRKSGLGEDAVLVKCGTRS